MAFRHSDDVPRSKETRESQIAHRKDVLDEARASGDPSFVQTATDKLNRALDNYTAEHRS